MAETPHSSSWNNESECPTQATPASADGGGPGRPTDFRTSGGFEQRPNDAIGPYRLLEQIGSGGFGEVWLAERTVPFSQRVAIKIIKPGMDSKEVIARFEQERQALAVMNHPNVAKVLDGGFTPLGRPYFVMEYVKGEAITAYCDRNSLSVEARLALFAAVCEAVQHAHSKGIIHRDIKPGNILVTVAEGAATPKVIDFGVAKAINHTFIGKTLFTERGQIIGTPEYMSPEQAEMGATDVDTRTDVYSLGVLLYELLTGALPFDPKSLRSAGYAEIQRIIREVDPPRPSTRLSSLADAAKKAGQRDSRVEALVKQLNRELEWVPLRAMHKDRTRRYQTPLELAEDVRNYLEGRPLKAGPDSAGYRLRKFARKHRGPILAGSLVAAALVGATVVSVRFGVSEARAREKEAAALAEAGRQRDISLAINEFFNSDLFNVDIRGRDPSEVRVIDTLGPAAAKAEQKYANRPEVARGILLSIGRGFISLGLPEKAIEVLQAARRLPYPDAKEASRQDAEIDSLVSEARFRIASSSEDVPVLEGLVRAAAAEKGEEHPDTLSAMNLLGGALKHSTNHDAAEALYLRVAAARTRVLGEHHEDTLLTQYNLALIPLERGKAVHKADPAKAAEWYGKGAAMMRSVRDVAAAKLGENHPVTLPMTSELASMLNRLGESAEARREYERALAAIGGVLGPTHYRTLETRANLGRLLQKQKDEAGAVVFYEEALDSYRVAHGKTHPPTIIVNNRLAECYEAIGKIELAEHALRRVYDDLVGEKVGGDPLRNQCELLATFAERRGEPAKAAEWRDKAKVRPPLP